jgi:UDP-glucose 4-epimerase
MKFLITGGLGFVGSHLIDSLSKRNSQILVLTRTMAKKNNTKNFPKNVKIKKVDITCFKKLDQIIEDYRPDVIFHLAGNTSHSKSFENPIKDVDSNTKTTLSMLEKIRKLKLPCKFILGSTFIVIGKPLQLPVNEKTPCNPTTIYGTNRLSSEYLCKIYHNVYDLDTNIFRITNSYGPREQIIPNKNAVNFLIHQAYKKEELSIFNKGKFFRDIIYIDDVITGILTILKKGKPGELYWISSNKKLWFNDFAKILQKLTKCNVNFVEAPKYTKKVDVGNFVVNNSKLKRLGWKPKINIESGLKKTIKHFDSK